MVVAAGMPVAAATLVVAVISVAEGILAALRTRQFRRAVAWEPLRESPCQADLPVGMFRVILLLLRAWELRRRVRLATESFLQTRDFGRRAL